MSRLNESVLDSLAKNYYAESFQGTMGAEKTNKLLRDWINRQTNDLLKGQTDAGAKPRYRSGPGLDPLF